MKDNPTYDAGNGWQNPGFAQTDAHPVVNVSHRDATEYMAWLTRKSGKQYTLPSEAQWEYAARGNKSPPAVWYWGNDFQDGAGYTPPRARGTVPVATTKEYGFGLYDMLGHVWQWTGDGWHED